ncbi:hypothetical protein LINGRAHAP2_LOCUS13689 [Linum grandiflorum]
MLGKQE